MGGNALKNTTTRRMSKDDYLERVSEVSKLLDSYISKFHPSFNLRYHVLENVGEKESFGDMDVLVSFPINENVLNGIGFAPKDIFINGSVASFDYRELQIDFITVPSSSFDYAKAYFNNGDLGNLLGNLAKHYGLKHGHTGLLLPVRDKDHLYTELLVTLDHDEFLELVGLDTDTFNKGFDTLEDMYHYVTTSPVFRRESYSFENLNAVARTRDKKRPQYIAFLKYLDDHPEAIGVPKKKDMTRLNAVFDKFPGLKDRYETVIKEMLFKQEYRIKLNGELVRIITGLDGKELGIFMSMIKRDSRFDPAVIILMPQEELEELIEDFYNEKLF
jgi:hypothetical protein